MGKIIALALLVIFSAQSTAAQLNVAFGSSVPADPSGQTYILASGPSRANGGERFVVKFNAPKTITEIKLISYSASRTGKNLIRGAKALQGATVVNLDGLFQFSKVTAGNPTNYQNLVLLPDTTWVAIAPNQAYAQIEITVEGFTNNDSSLLLQITSNENVALQEFLVTRTGSASNEIAGGLIDESRYAKFTVNELSKLMQFADPNVTDLAGKTFICSSYTKLDTSKIDLKRRTYSLSANGALQSSSDLQGANIPWAIGPEGLQMPVDNFTGCGRFTTARVVRKTGGGNLIGEVIVDLQKWVDQCAAAGFDPEGAKVVEENSTFPSMIDAKFRVDSYEFCRLSN